MKKILLISVMFITVLLVSGCSKEETTKVMSCKRNVTLSEEISMDFNYKITYKDKYVELLESTENIICDNNEYLEAYKTALEDNYKVYNDIKYYDNSVSIKDNILTSTIKINYAKIDTNKLIEIDSANGTLIKDGKVNIDDLKSAYEEIGATCE